MNIERKKPNSEKELKRELQEEKEKGSNTERMISIFENWQEINERKIQESRQSKLIKEESYTKEKSKKRNLRKRNRKKFRKEEKKGNSK